MFTSPSKDGAGHHLGFPDEDAMDENALLKIAHRNPAAFAHLYDRYVKPVYKFLLARTGDVAEAEDLTSITFLSAYERLPEYRHRGMFSAWLFRIARNKLIDFYRKNKHSLPLEGAADLCVEVDSRQDPLFLERNMALSRLLKTLSEPECELLQLRLVADLEFREIAVIQNKSQDAVKKAYYRLIDRIKKEME